MFKKEQELGEGTFGTVYKVKCLKSTVVSGEDGQRVAIEHKTQGQARRMLNMTQQAGVNLANDGKRKEKTMLQDQYYVVKVIDTSRMQKDGAFEALNEIDLLRTIDSHFIVGYFDSFIVDTQINIVMEYCQNHDLHGLVKKQMGKPMADNFIWKVFIHICLGIYYLHQRDIIHRDLKSLNIFLTKDKSAKVGDLGASRRLDKNGNIIDMDENGVADPEAVPVKVGTPLYLAPELWQDKPCTKKSDIWALGIILYEMCALRTPFQADDLDALKDKIQKEKYPPLPNNVHKFFLGII